MQWKKLGQIFDPRDHTLPSGCKEWSQSPQTLVFVDRVRIYFATRSLEVHTGKYVSHIAFVDFDHDFSKILGVSQNPVIGMGALGTFDEHGIFPLNPLRHNKSITAYTCGWNRRNSVSVDTAIGIVVSHDEGETFTRIGDGPVLAASQYEPFLVGDPFVQVYDGVYHMWYIFGVAWVKAPQNDTAERVYKIGHATSSDGIHWQCGQGHQIIPNRLDDNECQALPTVVRIGSRYHMVFCYRQCFDFRANKNNAYRLGYAFSDNLLDWFRDDAHLGIDVSPEDWDSDMQCYPHLFTLNDKIYLLYNGNAFGRYGFGLAILE